MRALRLKTVVILLLMFTVSSAYAFHNFPKEAADRFMNQEVKLRAVDKNPITVSKPTLDNILTVGAVQEDEVALQKLIKTGQMTGEVKILPKGTKVFWMKGVDGPIMMIRPEGSSQSYYAIRVYYEILPSAGDGEQK